MDNTTWLDYLTAFGSIATPILVVIFAIVGDRIKKQIERRIDLETKLREDRIEIYNQILEPYIVMLTSDTAWESKSNKKYGDKDKYASNKIFSLDYRRASMRMALVANDSVINSYNNLMQYFYINVDDGQTSDIVLNLGSFLLEIRKSMGNEMTKLDNIDMLKWLLKDLDKSIGNDNSID